jgi:hypothetical protein
MTDLGPHAALPTTQLPATFTRLLNSHKPALFFLESFWSVLYKKQPVLY